jgi:DNA-directed RNA polymerase specialized sigma24 family protein
LTGEPEIVSDLLGRLSFNQRAAVVLRFYAGFSTDEIATALDCPRGSVGPWIDRALNNMRKELS